jgi:hypothetical protein
VTAESEHKRSVKNEAEAFHRDASEVTHTITADLARGKPTLDVVDLRFFLWKIPAKVC